MRYFGLFEDWTIRKRWHIGEILLPDGAEPRLCAGIRMSGRPSLRAYVTHVGHVLDFCLTSFGIPIATKTLADAVRSVATEDMQILPITIANQSGMMVLNAVRLIRCVHEQRSEFDKITEDDEVRPDLAGKYRYISKLVLDRHTIPPDAHFFRVKDWEICLIVSEVVKDAMQRVGCYGAEFTELEMA